MTERAKFDVEVADLMERIRQEVATAQTAGSTDGSSAADADLPPMVDIPPRTADRLRVRPFRKDKLDQVIQRTRSNTEVSRWIPRFLRRLFRKQGAYNRAVLDTATLLARTAEQLHDATSQIAAIVEEQAQQLDALAAQLEDVGATMNAVSARVDELGDTTSRAATTAKNDLAYLRSQLAGYGDVIRQMTNVPSPAVPGTAEKTDATGDIDAHLLDKFYIHFENAFRGSRADIKQRVAIYLPYISSPGLLSIDRPLLDLGCGRGEWLEVLAEHQLPAHGVDLNREMVELCQAAGLEAKCADAVEYLRDIPDGALGAITSLHLIEHLPFPTLLRLLQQCRRTLQPRGLLILETPNPANIAVGAHYFYRDYTHQRPLPPDSTRFLVQSVGFASTELLPLHACATRDQLPDESEVNRRFNEYFYGPQDYAVIATK
jgi:2-polyprenyl-3-methyl-5-hydroxy-6-metoxy-1,4-benzoquinol methylase